MWLCSVEHNLPRPPLFTIFHTQTDTRQKDKHTHINANINKFQCIFLWRPRSVSDKAYMSSMTSAVWIKHIFGRSLRSINAICFKFTNYIKHDLTHHSVKFWRHLLITFWVMLILNFLLDKVLVLPEQFLSNCNLTLFLM